MGRTGSTSGLPSCALAYRIALMDCYMSTLATYMFNLGICSERNGDYLLALPSYRFATKIMPHLFVPKYYLFLFYKNPGQIALAKRIAADIVQSPVKTNSRKVLEIKEKASILMEE